MSGRYESALKPEDLARLFVERANAGDADGLAQIYAPDAVMAFPPGQTTVGRDAIRAVMAEMLAHVSHFEFEEPLPTLRHGDIAFTATKPRDDSPARAQVARQQPDGTWLRILDRPDFRG